jgi:hypothetical protein
MEWRLNVAGLGPIEHVDGVENVDLTEIVMSHDDYPSKMKEIMLKMKFH